jgi:hypothetical protein
MKRILKRLLMLPYRRIKDWLQEPEATVSGVPFDNRYSWLGATFEKLMRDPLCAKRPNYLWGVLQGVALGKVLGKESVSIIEFGVAEGAGLLALERIGRAWKRASRLESKFTVLIPGPACPNHRITATAPTSGWERASSQWIREIWKSGYSALL